MTGRKPADTLNGMRSCRLRRWFRAVALVLLAAALRLPHTSADDLACSSLLAALSTDGETTTVRDGAEAPAAPEHCAICHWTRLLRSPLTPAGVSIAPAGAATPLERGAHSVYLAPADDLLSARAPPARLL